MGDYKKKTVKPGKKSIKNNNRNVRKNAEKPKIENIKMSPQRKNDKSDSLNLVIGKKETVLKKKIVILTFCFMAVLAIVVFYLLTPTGIFDYIQNTFLSFGKGSFPQSLSGGELINTEQSGDFTYVLSDTHAQVFNYSGKELFSRQHEFSNPVMQSGAGRALIFDRGGKDLYIFNQKSVLTDLDFENEIYCSSIGRNGTYAVATKSVNYAAEVHVFNKNGKSKFVWYSSKEKVNQIAVSDNGRNIAVGTVSVNGGEYSSKVYVFKFSSANPIYEYNYDGGLIYSINSTCKNRFCVVTDKSIDFIKWSNGTRIQNEIAYTLSLFHCKNRSHSIAVSGNKTQNTITVYNKKGLKQYSLDFSGTISDVTVKNKTVFVLSDGYLYKINAEDGTYADKINIASYNRIETLDGKTVIAVGNFGIEKF